jgi:hypothetical protein
MRFGVPALKFNSTSPRQEKGQLLEVREPLVQQAVHPVRAL